MTELEKARLAVLTWMDGNDAPENTKDVDALIQAAKQEQAEVDAKICRQYKNAAAYQGEYPAALDFQESLRETADFFADAVLEKAKGEAHDH